MNIYDFNDYDRYNSLKVSPVLWLWMVYTMRHGLLLIGLFASNISHPINWMDDFTDEAHWAYILCGIPGMLLLIVLAKRHPDAGMLMRWIWHSGRNLLALSLVLHLIISLTLAEMNPKWQLSVPQTIFFLFDVIGFIYLYGSKRVKDIFADFPSAELVNNVVNENLRTPN